MTRIFDLNKRLRKIRDIHISAHKKENIFQNTQIPSRQLHFQN